MQKAELEKQPQQPGARSLALPLGLQWQAPQHSAHHCCFPRHISGKLDGKWSSRKLNMDVGTTNRIFAQCHNAKPPAVNSPPTRTACPQWAVPWASSLTTGLCLHVFLHFTARRDRDDHCLRALPRVTPSGIGPPLGGEKTCSCPR